VANHLSRCEACRREYRALEELNAALADPLLWAEVLADPAPLPADFSDRVMARVQAEHGNGFHLVLPWLRQRWSRGQYVSLAYALGATTVVVSLGNMLFLWSQCTQRLAVWAAQGLAFWAALQARLDAFLSGWVAALFQIG